MQVLTKVMDQRVSFEEFNRLNKGKQSFVPVDAVRAHLDGSGKRPDHRGRYKIKHLMCSYASVMHRYATPEYFLSVGYTSRDQEIKHMVEGFQQAKVTIYKTKRNSK